MSKKPTRNMTLQPVRIGIDLGGTKIAAIAFDHNNEVVLEKRIPSPQDDYNQTVSHIVDLVQSIDNALEHISPEKAQIGIGIPGSISPVTGYVQNANSTWLNGRDLYRDLTQSLNRPIRLANDANCFTLSEALDGAGHGAKSVFGVIIGTGCGGGFVYDGQLVNGPRNIAGEWGHTPLPWPEADEYPGERCWCGRIGCLETWISGPALSRDHYSRTSQHLTAKEITERANNDDPQAQFSLERYISRLARGLASIVCILDPEVIVLGGGLSQIEALYESVPEKMAPFLFGESKKVDLRPPIHGDASGVRGAAFLWY